MQQNVSGSGTQLSSGNWKEEVTGVEIAQLIPLANKINKTVDTTVKQVARGKIAVGKLLLEARAIFESDQAFGSWRKAETSVQSKQHAHYLMKIAERFGDATVLIEGANYSVMQELLLADQKDIQWVVDKIDNEEPLPTVQEVREKVKETKGTSKKGTVVVPMSGPKNPNIALNELVQLGLTLRIQQVVDRQIKDIEGDYIILGMDPDPQCPCHPHVLKAARDLWVLASENGDEERAVKDSYERVQAEFDNWEW
jgi:hypothetical protein